jgi:hypothetical protein
MLGSTTIEILIGIIIVFILVSTICTTIREGLESILKTRAAYLDQGIRQLLNDKAGSDLAKKFYEHPLIFGLFNGDYKPGTDVDSTSMFAKGKNLPSYIPSKNFARALMDIAAAGVGSDAENSGNTAPVVSLDNMRQNISSVGNIAVQRVLLNAIDLAQGDLDKAQANIENWFNSGMDRVSGWYRRSTQWIIFVISLFVSVGMNIDTIKIINYLANSDTARKVMVKEAETLNKSNNAGIEYKTAQKRLDQLALPIGWNKKTFRDTFYLNEKKSEPLKFGDVMLTILGWLITALAATLGAPYWFDLLNKVMVIRSTVKPHEKSLEEGSQDARAKTTNVYVGTQQETGDTVITNPGQQKTGEDADGCDIKFDNITADEELPASKGGTEL